MATTVYEREMGDANPGHIGGRRVLSPLRHPCFLALGIFNKAINSCFSAFSMRQSTRRSSSQETGNRPREKPGEIGERSKQTGYGQHSHFSIRPPIFLAPSFSLRSLFTSYSLVMQHYIIMGTTRKWRILYFRFWLV